MEITKNIYIDSSRNLHIEVSIGEDTSDAWIKSVLVYNHKSFIDGNPIYSTGDMLVSLYSEVITENNLAAMDLVLNDSCYVVDLHNSLIIVVVNLDYSPTYLATQPCCNTPGFLTFATYYPCTIYNRILPSIRELELECNAVPMNFVDGLLKKKAIDVCIESGHYELACKYWCKFYTHGGSTMGSSNSRGGCGCHG